jgi:DNA primase large subunit
MLSKQMNIENLPWWYILHNPPNKELDLDELAVFGNIRFNMLKDLKISDINFNKDKPFLFLNFINKFYLEIDKNNFKNEQIEIYFLGHWFLRIAASISNRIESWLVESEGDLFEQVLNIHSNDEQLNIFRLIAESEKMVTEPKNIQNNFFIPNELIKNNYWAIHWSLVPDLVGSKKGALYSGYLIGHYTIFQKQIKKLFEKKLKKSINVLKKNENFLTFIESNKSLQNSIKDLEKNLVSTFKDSNYGYYFDSLDFSEGNITEDFDYYPPCMRFLMQDVKENGYIKHNYRFQLGLFLKKIGMDVTTQLHFWYDLAVDNVGLTYDQFEKRAGYLIRHIYGLEGSKTDYEVPKCKKLMTDYFCLFTHIKPGELENILPKMYNNSKLKEKSTLQQIIQSSGNFRPNDACSNTFQILFEKPKKIFHPLYWVKSGYEIRNGETQKEKE